MENALYSDERVLEVAAVGVPDKRLGELVAAIVSVKPAFRGKVTEASLIAVARKRCLSTLYATLLCSKSCVRLPKFAVPVMILVQNEPFGRPSLPP